MRITRIAITIICIVLVTFVGTCLFISYAFYSPHQIAQHKVLSRITDVDFPELRILAENGVDNCWYWIQASFEELPNEEFYTSIENSISEGNKHWKIVDDKYIFNKEKINIEIKKYKTGIYINMSEFLFIWE